MSQVMAGRETAAEQAHVPAPRPAADDAPRTIGRYTTDDLSAIIGAFAASLSVVWVLYSNIFPTAGRIGFFLCWYAAFIGFYALVTSFSHSWPVVRDRVAASAVTGGAAVVIAALVWMIGYTIFKGWAPLHHLNFWTHSQSATVPDQALTTGGILNAIIGTVVEVGIAVLISVPAGIGAAICMTEVGGRLSRVVRTVIEAMTALPDLVAGLFIYYFLILLIGGHWGWAGQNFATKNGFAAAAALSITMLPIVARSSETVLRVVPSGLREAGLALGSSQWATVRRVVLPTARAGLATAVILGIARAVGETAPVLIVSAPSTYFQANPFGSKTMNSLPLAAYNYIRYGTTDQEKALGYGTACVLLLLVIVLFVTIRLLTRQRKSR